MLVPLAALLIALATPDAPAAPDVAVAPIVAAVESSAQPAREPNLQLSIAAATKKPLALPGVAVGAVTECLLRLPALPAFVFARLGYAQASAANVAWTIDHYQLDLAVGGGLAAQVGVGRLFVLVGGGASAVYQVLGRHQRQRISAAGVPGDAVTTLVGGPLALAEAGVELQLREEVSAVLAAGGDLARLAINGQQGWRARGSARVGVAYAF